MILPEVYLRVVSCFQIVAPNTAHIFGNDSADLTCFHISYKPFPSRTLKVAAAITVICIVLAIREVMLLGIILQIDFLIRDGVALSKLFIVPGQPLIQRCNHKQNLLCKNFSATLGTGK